MKSLMKVLVSVFAAMMLVVVAQAAMDEASIKERTMPVGKVCLEGEDCGSASAAVAAGPMGPEDIYNNNCAACHATGALNAPKFGDAAAWAERSSKGIDTLISNAIGGINSMPPMGACGSCSEDDIAETVRYMVDNSQ